MDKKCSFCQTPLAYHQVSFWDCGTSITYEDKKGPHYARGYRCYETQLHILTSRLEEAEELLKESKTYFYMSPLPHVDSLYKRIQNFFAREKKGEKLGSQACSGGPGDDFSSNKGNG